MGFICLIATFILAFTHEITKPKIEEQIRREEEAALKAILPEADYFRPGEADGIEYFEGLRQSELIGYCLKVTGSGYGGYIHMMVGIDPSGVIKGVRILEHHETPGLGSKIDEIRKGDSSPYFLRQFVGKRGDSLAIRKNIDAITGATISSKAVTDAIQKTVSEFLQKVKR